MDFYLFRIVVTNVKFCVFTKVNIIKTNKCYICKNYFLLWKYENGLQRLSLWKG